jgi:hypothetical protein
LHRNEPHDTPPHSHPWDELTCVLEGEMEFTAGTQTLPASPGTLVSLPRGVPHTLRVPSRMARFLMLTAGVANRHRACCRKAARRTSGPPTGLAPAGSPDATPSDSQVPFRITLLLIVSP